MLINIELMNMYINKIYKGGIIMYQEWFKEYEKIVNKDDKKNEQSKN